MRILLVQQGSILPMALLPAFSEQQGNLNL